MRKSEMPSFLLFCHRFFELRYIAVTGIVQHLADRGNVTILMPVEYHKSLSRMFPENVTIRAARYGDKLPRWREALLNVLGDILYLTFPNTKTLPNATAKFHRDYYTPAYHFMYYPVVWASKCASYSKLVLKLIRTLYQALLPKRLHSDLIAELKPDVMIGCSFGLGVEDAAFLLEARHNGVPSAVVVQTWDRSSNKGYPTVHPDYALVWNDIMKLECLTHLEFQSDRVLITGAPLWDQHFKKLDDQPDANWRKNLNIADNAKVIFLACGEFRSHQSNMHIAPKVFELADKQPFENPVHVVYRLYPYYISPSTKTGVAKRKREELEAVLDRYRDHPSISILYPDFEFDGENFIPQTSDHEYMTECLRQCDVSISTISSQMIEACLFDKPAINIEYGKREAEKYVLDMLDYRPEHLLRIYRTNAIYRVHNDGELLNSISSALNNPSERHEQRLALLEQEAPVYRKKASEKTAEFLYEIATGTIDV